MNPLKILEEARLQVAGMDNLAWKFLLDAYQYVRRNYPHYVMDSPNYEFWRDYK